MKKIFKWILSKWKYILIIILIIASLWLLIKLSSNQILLAIFSGLFGSLCVSLVFELINDINKSLSNKRLISQIRIREFAPVKRTLSSFIRNINTREDSLLETFNLTSSFTNGKIDISNFEFNMFVFKNAFDRLGKSKLMDNDKEYVKENISCLLMQDNAKENEVERDTPDLFYEFHEFNEACIQLYKKMEQLNLDYNLNIFSNEEINAIDYFSREIKLREILKFYYPYRLVKILEQILNIEKFLKANFTPFYKNPAFGKFINNLPQNLKKMNKEMEEYIKKNDKLAIEYLDKLSNRNKK